MTLYELTGDFQQLYEMADDPDIDEEAWLDTMEGIDGAIEDKADGYACVIKSLMAEARAIREEEARLKQRRTVMENRVDQMKRSLQTAMELTGKTKFKTLKFSFGIQKNPPSVVIDGDVPKEYLIPQPPRVDTVAIRETLKETEGGRCEFAHLEQGESLRIR